MVKSPSILDSKRTSWAMVKISLRYGFRQKLRVPARAAYAWATDFRNDDGRLFSQTMRRSVRRIAEDAIVMTDLTYPEGRPRRIRRLVRMDPQRMSWTNTHLNGPFRHSQFWYRIVPEGPRACRLEFDGLMLEDVPKAMSSSEIARRARENQVHDSTEWRRCLAPALESEAVAR